MTKQELEKLRDKHAIERFDNSNVCGLSTVEAIASDVCFGFDLAVEALWPEVERLKGTVKELLKDQKKLVESDFECRKLIGKLRDDHVLAMEYLHTLLERHKEEINELKDQARR